MINKLRNIANPFVVAIIDDEVDTCLLLGMFLKRYGIETTVAHSLSDGFDICEEKHPNLIFLDNNLPDGFGIENISKLQKNNKKASIVMISAMSNLKTIALENGASQFVDKPLTPDKIKAVLENFVAQQAQKKLP